MLEECVVVEGAVIAVCLLTAERLIVVIDVMHDLFWLFTLSDLLG